MRGACSVTSNVTCGERVVVLEVLVTLAVRVVVLEVLAPVVRFTSCYYWFTT